MCLLLFAYRQISDVPIFLAANREESPARPSILPELVRESHGVCWFGGRDGIAGGTWLGINQAGLVVGITNRSDRPAPPLARSRGLLCRELLKRGSLADAVDELNRQLRQRVFAGFNLLLASRDESLVVEHGAATRYCDLAGGLHVLTNSGMDDAVNPRVERARSEFEGGFATDASLPSLISVAKNVCRLTELPPAPLTAPDGPLWGTVSASVIALPDHPAAAEFHYAAGPPRRTPFQSYAVDLQAMLRMESANQPPMSIHRIHLKGPWEYAWLHGSPADSVPTGRVTMPADWRSLFGTAAGRAVFRRCFHCPTNLDPDDRVWIVFDGVGGRGSVSVNGHVVGRLSSSDEPQRFEMTARLQPFNEAAVELEFDPAADADPGGLHAPVAIEIESKHKW